jgi:hypothetical protein
MQDRLEIIRAKLRKCKVYSSRYSPRSELMYEIEEAEEDVRWMIYEIERLREELRRRLDRTEAGR